MTASVVVRIHETRARGLARYLRVRAEVIARQLEDLRRAAVA